jgi:hypothetical protein
MPEDEVDTRPVLYGRHASPFVRRVAVTLRLYGIDYDHVPLMPFGPGQGGTGGLQSDCARAGAETRRWRDAGR